MPPLLVQFLKSARSTEFFVGQDPLSLLGPPGRELRFDSILGGLLRGKQQVAPLALFKMEILAIPELSSRPVSAARRLQTSSHSRLPNAERRA